MSIAQQNETTKPNNASNDQNSRKELFRKVLRMFSDRHVAGVHVRQARAISRACSAVTDGVHYNELEYFVKMLDYCSCRSIMPECCSVTPNEKEKENRPSTNPNVQKRERQSKSALPLERKEETLFELKSDNRTSSAENKMRLTISTPTLTSEVQSESKVLDQTNDIIIENEEKSTTELEKETNETQNDTKAIEEIVTLYRPSVLAVLKCLHKPFIKDKVSDQQTYRKDILELLTKVIQVFSTNNISEDLQTEAVILLASLLTFTPTAFFVDVFSEAKIVQALANALHTSKGKLTIAILSTLCDCTFQKKLAQEIRHSNTVIEDVICHFSHGIRSLGFDISVELLWNILENANNPMQSIDLKLWVNSLKSAFTEIMKHGVSLLDKTTRNEVLLLTSYAARDERTHTFFASLGYLDDVMLYLTIIEQNKLNTLQNKNFLMVFHSFIFFVFEGIQ